MDYTCRMVPLLHRRVRRDENDDYQVKQEDLINMTSEESPLTETASGDVSDVTSIVEEVEDVTSGIASMSEMTSMKGSEVTSTSDESLVVLVVKIEERFGSKYILIIFILM